MDEAPLTKAIHKEFYELCDRLNTTASLNARGLLSMPGGVANSLHSMRPWPIAIESGKGTELIDVDGNIYRDFHNAFGTAVCGHGNPLIANAIKDLVDEPLVTGFVHPDMIELAETITKRFLGDQVVLTNSGTEATQLAIRIARAATGKEKIIKVEGGYHGTHDSVMVSTHPAIDKAGLPEDPQSVSWGNGVPDTSRKLTDVIPFNDLSAAEEMLSLEEHACLIIEPVMLNVGFVEPENDYLSYLRDLCSERGVVFIADEVKTGVTVGYHGACYEFDIDADLICLGKGIAGGLPIGGVVGSSALMNEILEGRAPHYSTFAANPLVVQAALVALKSVLVPKVYDHFKKANKILTSNIDKMLDEYDLPGFGVFMGAKGNVIFADKKLRNYRDYAIGIDRSMTALYWLCMMNNGILLSSGADEQWTVSVATSNDDIDAFLSAFRRFCEVASQALNG